MGVDMFVPPDMTGVDMTTNPDGGVDMSRVFGAPAVIQALPEPGAENVDPMTNVLLIFSEEMDPTVGTVTLQPGNIELNAGTAEWFSGEDLGVEDWPENVAVRFSLPVTLTGGVEYTGFVQQDFMDATGVALDDIFTWTFQVVDAEPPVVVSSTPAEGDMNVSATRTEFITFQFSEQMATTGNATLEGPGVLGDPIWDVRSVSYPVSGLQAEQAYRVLLDGFTDEAGNPLDGDPYLIDGRLNFRTGADVDAPRVVASNPAEGMRGANPATRTVRLEFDEPMDTSTGLMAFFSDGTTTVEVRGTWEEGGRAIVYDVSGVISGLGTYALDVSTSGLQDRAGNALDLVFYLGDGAVNFEVGEDRFGPTVADSDPEEGETDVRFTITGIEVRFDEPMDTTSSSAVLNGGAMPIELVGTWSTGDTVVRFNVAGRLRAGTAYSLDLSSFRDAGGNALNPTPYLMDGSLDFTTEPATGDTCLDPLTRLAATDPGDGSLVWMIDSRDFVDNGATDTCDADSSGASDDAVIQYVKTTPSLADGGAALEILVENPDDGSTTDLNWELREGVCQPPASITEDDPALLVCYHELQRGGKTIDVGPGTYFIWVAKDTTGMFPGARVTVREAAAFPEGESCDNPYTTSSSTYVAPRTPGGAHVWQIPVSSAVGFDRDRFSGGAGSITCAGGMHGADAVIEFTKAAGSVLRIRSTPGDIRTSAANLDLEVSLGCNPAQSSFTSLSCLSSFEDPETFEVSGPAGPIYIWVAGEVFDKPFPGATVSIEEIMVNPGESCGAARDITGPTGSVTLDSTRALGGGSCLPAGEAITWYAYTPTDDIVVTQTDMAGAIVLRDQITDRELGCADDATAGVPALVPAGSKLCIGIPESATLSSLTFTERAYSGIQGNVTDPMYRRALTSSGGEESWTSDYWMSTTPTTVYLGEGTSPYVYQIPKAAGSRAVLYSTADGVTSARGGYTGITVGEQVFSVDDSFNATSNRVFRLWDTVSAPWSPDEWDVNPMYDTSEVRAITEDPSRGVFIYATHDSSDVTLYTLPTNMPGEPVVLGTNTRINDVRGIAADDTYIYLCGDVVETSGTVSGALARIPRAQLSNPAFVPEVIADITASATVCPIFVDSMTSASYLYYRHVATTSSGGNYVGVIVDPGSAAPFNVGQILLLGGSSDYAMTYDAGENAIYLFETETTTVGRIVRVQ